MGHKPQMVVQQETEMTSPGEDELGGGGNPRIALDTQHSWKEIDSSVCRSVHKITEQKKIFPPADLGTDPECL